MSKTPLTAKAIEAAQPQDKPYKLTDSLTPGLFLLVHPNGSKYWRFRYWIDKKERLQAIGVYPLISLKEARKRATESRLLIAKGDDPIEVARKERQLNDLNAAASFKAMANEWYQTKVSSWSEGYARQVRAALDKDVLSVIGKQSVSKIYLFKNVYIHCVHIYMRSFPFMQSKLHSSASLSALSFPASWKGPFTHAQPANQTNIPSWRFVHG